MGLFDFLRRARKDEQSTSAPIVAAGDGENGDGDGGDGAGDGGGGNGGGVSGNGGGGGTG